MSGSGKTETTDVPSEPPRTRRPSIYSLRERGIFRMAPTAFVELADGRCVTLGRTRFGLALDGDEVLVDVRPGKKGLEGRVVEIVHRAHERLTGIVHLTRDGAWLQPDGQVTRPVLIVGTIPVLAGDDIICGVELDFDEARSVPQGQLTKTFGRRGDRTAEVEAVRWRAETDAEQEINALYATFAAADAIGTRAVIEVLEPRDWGALCRIAPLGVEGVCVVQPPTRGALERGATIPAVIRGASLSRRVIFIEPM